MIRRPGLIWTFPLLALLIHSAAAYAAPGDPAPGSPSGSVYKLPLEAGRADAAPRGDGGNGAVATGEDGEGSFYRSENNFGSSAEVPGDPAGEQSVDRSSNAPDGSQGHGSGGEGGSGSDPQHGSSGGPDGDAIHVADTGNTSPSAALGLLGAIGLVAAGIGVFAARRGRLSSG